MEKPKLPVKVRLGKLSDDDHAYAVYFQIYDEFWTLQYVWAIGKKVILERSTRVQVAEIQKRQNELIDNIPGKFGVSSIGYLYPIKKALSKAAISRYVRQDGKLLIWNKKSRMTTSGHVRIMVDKVGNLFASDGFHMHLIKFSAVNKIPITLGRDRLTHSFHRILSKKFLFSAEGSLLRPLEPIIEIVMKNSLRFVDPIEFKISSGGRQQLVFTLGNVYDS